MSKKIVLNLFLLIVFFGLANIIYFSETKDNKLQRLSNLDITSIDKIKIKHNTYTTAINKQTANHWVIYKPVIVDANEFRINSILKLINAPVHSQYPSSAIDAAAIGLDTPSTSITFNNHTIFFGTVNPATGLRYVQFNDMIYTLEDVYYPLISSHFGTLASLNLLSFNSKIQKLILMNQTIDKNNNGLWQSNITITADNIAKTIDSWQTIQAFGVHEYIERKALGDVFIYTEKSLEPISYQITDTEPWLIIARPELGLEYHLNIEAYDQLISPR